MNDDLLEVLVEQDESTLLEWRSAALEAVRAGDYITSASTGGGVQYAKARSIRPLDWLAAINQALKRKRNPNAVQCVGQCSTVIFTRTLS